MKKEKLSSIAKKSLGIAVCLSMATLSLVGCSTSSSSAKSGSSGQKEIIIISKSFNNQFYQAAFKGAQDAASKFNVKVVTDGPDAESDIPQQVEKVESAINKKPAAICIAACDPSSLTDVLSKAKSEKIPIIGFDSGIPGDTTGAVVATATTDNKKAGANDAKNLSEDSNFKSQLSKATTANPVVVGVLAQDATSGSITQRVTGFVNELKTDIENMDGFKGTVDISGQQRWTIKSSSAAKVKIVVTVPPTTSQSDIQSAASTILKTKNLIAVFGANQDGVNGFLSATADGNDLKRDTGKYKDLLVVGFDSGTTQRNAIKAGEFLGSVTQDPYMMGYDAVQLAVEASEGKSVSDIDTGSKWYNKGNIDSPDISKLLYD